MDIDWLKASEDERKHLYVATRAVADASGTSVEEIMDAALGRKALMGTDYMSTFRRGKIRRSYAKLIYAWIKEHHGGIAHEIAPDLFVLPHTSAWDQHIAAHAIHGQLRIARFGKSEFGLIQRAREAPKPVERLKLGENFCFHLSGAYSGSAVAFQGYQGQWHPLPLGLNGDPVAGLTEGDQFLPINAEGQPEPLVENEDLGLHRFLLVTGSDRAALPTDTSKPLDPALTLHLVAVQVVA